MKNFKSYIIKSLLAAAFMENRAKQRQLPEKQSTVFFCFIWTYNR